MPAQSDMMCVHGQSCLTLCNSMDCSPPGFSVHELFQARILEWLSFPSPGNLPDPGIKATSRVSPALASGFFTTALPGTNTEFPIWHHSPGAVFLLVTLDYSYHGRASVLSLLEQIPTLDADLHFLHAMLLPKLPSGDSENTLFTIMIFHTILLHIKEITSQQRRYNNRPRLVEITTLG